MTEAAAVTAPAAGEGTAPSAPQTTGIPGKNEGAPAPKSNERLYTVKLPDGREEQWPESRIVERAQKSVGLEKRVADADKYEKAFNSFVARVQDPSQLLELLNHPDLKYDDAKQEALITSMLGSKKPSIVNAVKKWLYDNEVVPSMMDPKEREAMEWKQKAEMLESDKLKREKAEKEAEDQKNQESIKSAYRAELGKAFTESGLPVDDYLVRQVMEKARLYVRAGKHPDFKNCCNLVQADFVNHVKGVLGKATVDNILNLMDGESAQKINKALISALNKKQEPPVEPGTETPKLRRREKERTPAETKKWIRNLERGIVD